MGEGYGPGHVPPDDLASIALDGAQAAPAELLAEALPHLADCRRCRDVLAGLLLVVAAARAAPSGEDLLVAPPARVWRDILAHHRGPSAPTSAHKE
ncbi:hypothetical protein ABZX30_12610 [Streptomyces sp. NPDC004542]|uniref:hypothetical protein n=1 Tax=Streptomyces sp. NPDC004542 TaxID=3154281 RepID=UPI0033B19543